MDIGAMNLGMQFGLGGLGPGMGAANQFGLGQTLGQMAQMGNPTENVVEVIQVPDHTVGLVIGRGGEQISQIQAQSNARVQMAPDSEGTRHRQCTIQGTKMSVDHAKKLIFEVINRAGNRLPPNRFDGGMGATTVEIPIPAAKCGLIIGKQGETIKNLQEQAGVKMVMIQENQEVTGQPKPLRISGDPEKVEHAKCLVAEILSSREEGMMGGRLNYPNDGQTSKGEVVVVPRSAVGMIIGKGGETIKRLGVETGAKIQFQTDDDPTTPERCAIVTGTREQIYKANQLIADLIRKSAAQGQGGGADTFYMHVPANKTGLVIGKGGETIKQICAESGAHCELSRDPPPNANEKVFIIKGNPSQIHNAQHIIRMKVGEVAPGTPLPPLGGPGGPQVQNQMFAPQQNAPQQYGQFPQVPSNQWNSNFGAAQQQPSQTNGWGAPAQFFDASGATAQSAPQQVGGMPSSYQQQSQQFGQTPQPASNPLGNVSSGSTHPTINPQTGQPDYSLQWLEYYRQTGMHEQAALIENQLKQQQQQSRTTASAASTPAQFGGYAPAQAAPTQAAGAMSAFGSASQQYPYSQQPY